VRLRVYDRSFGLCAWCNYPIRTGDLEVDHKLALINGGKNRESNLEPLHRACHKAKTVADVKVKARIHRKRIRHLLRRVRRITAWRRFDGTIVRKPRER
jgi:5-methylcytosine-specific restriction endonuclease McrA